MSDRFFIDTLNVGSALMSLFMMLYCYHKVRQKLLSLFYGYLVFATNLHLVIFYCVVLYSRWALNIHTSIFFQDWSTILRFLTFLFYGAFVIFVIENQGKGGKYL